MSTAIITGLAGLVRSEPAWFCALIGTRVVGIDTNMCGYLSRSKASTLWNREKPVTLTNRVYGDTPHGTARTETDAPSETDAAHPCQNGVPEEMSIDQQRCNVYQIFIEIYECDHSRWASAEVS